MTKKTKSSDVNVTAFEILNAVTGELPCHASPNPTKRKALPPAKNPAAVALGRLGGLKGGKARAKKLTAKKRTEIAQKAARSRWESSKS
ncbi:MAG TPA: hypothetical protein VGQ08_01705 [Nitrospiraceae bacterium]|jgi:hypothetical protein|nr:hypothetical protein [Nitrospiraceae bacterium]